MMKLYPSYKDSRVEWIGKIPDHWKLKRLKFTAKMVIGGIWGNEPTGDENDLKCIRVNDFDYEKLSIMNNTFTSRNIPFNNKENSRIIKKGDLLIEKSGGGDKTPVGKVVVYENEIEGKYVCSNFIELIHPDLEKYNPRFLVYYHSKLYSDKVNTKSIKQTTGIQNLDMLSYLDEKIALPDIIEQDQIVQYLEYKTKLIEKLIRETKKKIELLKEKRTVLINYCVTKGLDSNVRLRDSGIEWIGKIPFKWDVISIKYILDNDKNSIRTGPFGSQLKSIDIVENGIKIYNQRTVYDEDFTKGEIYITQKKFEKLKGFEVKRGDILISSRGTIGKMAIVPDDAELGVLHPCLIRIRVNTNYLNKKYLWWYINHSSLFLESVKYESNSTTIDVIYSNILTEIKLPLPPLPEQKQIIEYLDEQTQKVDTVIEKETKRMELLKEYRQSLISEVVTGKIDVRDEVVV